MRSHRAARSLACVRWFACVGAILALPGVAFTHGARQQEVDFRAIGNEPPWILQIQSGERIVLATGYEQTQHVFPATEPVVDEAAGRRTYRTSADGRTLTVVIDEQPCRDTMSGEAFPATVVVRFDGEIYRGCGRPVG